MGSSGSVPRKVTIENHNDASVIKITENVVDRLYTQEAKITPEDTKEEKKPETKSDFRPNSTVGEVVFVTSHQIRSEINNEIEKNNAYWESRLKVLRDGYRKINNELEEEYNKAVKEVNQSLGVQYLPNAKSDLESCKRTKSSVIECYSQNKDRPLLCSEEVQKFNECVSSKVNILLRAK